MPKIINTVRVKGATNRKINGVIERAVRNLNTGRGEAARGIWRRIGMEALSIIREAFLVKAKGGTDAAGLRWEPLKPETIAYSRRHKHFLRKGGFSKTRWLPKGSKRAASRPSYALTPQQRAKWWSDYKRLLAVYGGDKGHAAAVAWIIAKNSGAVTLFMLYAHTPVEILRDTGLLLNSLSPGEKSPPHRILRVGKGEVIVGTNRKHAASHHKGIPGKLPKRPLWPQPRRWPKAWWAKLQEQARAGVVKLIENLLR